MEDKDDLDLLIQRATGAALWEIKDLVEQLTLLPPSSSAGPVKLSARQTYVSSIIAKLDLFQEDPLLLDPLLRELLSPLVDTFLRLIRLKDYADPNSATRTLSSGVGHVIYHFCKVRGAKVITRLLTNEPRWVEPMLQAYAVLVSPSTNETPQEVPAAGSFDGSFNWQEQYVVLLWLGHLMYTPFDLATLSADGIALLSSQLPETLKIPQTLPEVATRIVSLALDQFAVADKRQPAAAALLTRLVVRPDMRAQGLLGSLMQWALQQLDQSNLEPDTLVHAYVGLLTFINGTVSAADVSDISNHLQRLFHVVTRLFGDEAASANVVLTSSAVAKKMAIKIQRNIILKVWNAPAEPALDPTVILEDTIDFLLSSLADRDTQTRKAASKALSIITGKIDPDMGQEVVEAVIGSLEEDVLTERGAKSLQAVNALRWHGLTLTLAQMLFRRHPSPSQLPQILTALFRALSFEQRSTAGSSVGGNVRDAANFGLWSLARRYTSKELQQIDPMALESSSGQANAGQTVVQMIASQLVAAACLDPVGNVRRGSSAALQELIGRHPDDCHAGIPLVQAVDYHAVGLRRRAMVDVAQNAACLHDSYLTVLLDGLLGWRGIEAIDKQSRENAAEAVGRLSCLMQDLEPERLLKTLINRLSTLKRPGVDVEERHGLLSALAACIDNSTSRKELVVSHMLADTLQSRPFATSAEDYRSFSVRPELTAAATLRFSQSIFRLSSRLANGLEDANSMAILNSFYLALANVGETDFTLATETVETLGTALSVVAIVDIAVNILDKSKEPDRVHRGPALILGLGILWRFLPTATPVRASILADLCRRASISSEVEIRVIAIRSIGFILKDQAGAAELQRDQEDALLAALDLALNDYTTNERGDVGSLLRCEALAVLETMPLRWSASPSELAPKCYWTTTRLAVERLHRVRVAAWTCLQALKRRDTIKIDREGATTIADVSTFEYFCGFASLLAQPPAPLGSIDASRDQSAFSNLATALLEGFASSAGGGNESVLDNSRFALLFVLDALPVHDTTGGASSLLSTATYLNQLLRDSLSNERVLVPLLELTGFLLDAQAFSRLLNPDVGFKWRTLLSLVQKAHFKSSSMFKLAAALSIYRSLAEVPQIRAEAVTKLVSMLAHRFPRIREAAAEAMWTVTADPDLQTVEWTRGSVPKQKLEALKEKYAG